VARTMVAETKCKLATNTILLLLCHYSRHNIDFHNSSDVILYPQRRSATNGYLFHKALFQYTYDRQDECVLVFAQSISYYSNILM